MDEQKPDILVFPFDLMSHYLRCIVFAKNFAGNYNVRFRSSAKFNSFIIDEGFQTFDCEEFDSGFVLEHMKNFSFKWLEQKQVESIFNQQLICIKKYKPAFVIGDMSPTLKMAAEAANVQFVSIINGYMSKYYALQRPIGSAHPVSVLQKIIPPHIFNPILEKQEAKAFKKIHKPFKKIRKAFTLIPQETFLDELEGSRTYICDDAEVFPQKQLPGNYEITGPLIYISNKNGKQPEISSGEKKKILVSFGSSGDWKKVRFLNNKSFSEYRIIALGDSENILQAGHITKFEFADMQQIMAEVDLLICHGGNGTLNLARKFRIPFIALPSIMEQEWNAARFSEVGSGKMFTRKINEKMLLSAVNEFLQTPYMASGKNA